MSKKKVYLKKIKISIEPSATKEKSTITMVERILEENVFDENSGNFLFKLNSNFYSSITQF